MDALPLETLQHIFELACTDGGSTGCALSLTSRGIRAATRRIRFHSLYITADRPSFQQFVSFLECEYGKGERERPRVRHLFLTLGGRESWYIPLLFYTQQQQQLRLRAGSVPTESASHGLAQPTAHSDAHMVPKEPSQSNFLGTSEAVQKLVHLVARDLWSLVVHVGPFGLNRDLQFPILQHTFPLARELAFLGICSPDRLLPPGANPSLVFPAATHLHIAPPLGNRQLCLPEWCTMAPRVTHLYVSSIGQGDEVLQLAEAVGVHVVVSIVVLPPPDAPPPVPPRTYPSVRHLLVEPSPRPRGGRCGNPSMAHSAMNNALVRLVHEFPARHVGVTAGYIPEFDSAKPMEHDAQRLALWHDRLAGNEGWWAGLLEVECSGQT
ncbi:hypothetical protein C2E23DRAFT_499776 [Lenzites betulinus]|nr:hypothetical protein C2E23DRAFT_499776 [Lenzites betulinus]